MRPSSEPWPGTEPFIALRIKELHAGVKSVEFECETIGRLRVNVRLRWWAFLTFGKTHDRVADLIADSIDSWCIAAGVAVVVSIR